MFGLHLIWQGGRAAPAALLAALLLALAVMMGGVLGGAPPVHAQEAALDVLLTPSSGPDASVVDIRVSNAEPGATITVALPGETVVGIADVQGLFIHQAVISGCQGEAITVDVTAESATTVQTGSAVFTVTQASCTLNGGGGTGESSPTGSGDVLLRPGGNLVAYLGPSLPVEEALTNAGATVDRVWAFDASVQVWNLWSLLLPASLRGFAQLESGTAYFFFASAEAPWSYAPGSGVPVGESSDPLTVMSQPTVGPSGTLATITVADATQGQPFTVIAGNQVTQGTVGEGGMILASLLMTGTPDQSIPITVIVGASGAARVGTASFGILGSSGTAPEGQQPLGVTLEPSEGESGTQGFVVVTGATPGAHIALIVGGTVNSGTADANGTLINQPTFTGAAGTTINVTAVTGAQGEERAGMAQFRILSPTGTLPTAQTLPISLSPQSGPSGTQAAIAVTGLEAGEAITVVIGTTVITGEANASGTFVTVQLFTGPAGGSVAVTAIAGPVGGVRVGTTAFQITS